MCKNKKRILIIAAGLVLLFSAMSFSVKTADASASKIDIYVGYYGGPYYLKKSYSVNDMYSLPTHRRVYSFIDAAPRPCLDCAIGVDMEDLISDAQIDMNSIETFYFYTSDSGDTYYTSFPKSELIDTVRYYYPELYRHFDKLQGGTEGAEEGAVTIPAMLAISDDFIKMEAGDTFVENYDNQTSENRFRLLFGQTDTVTRNATRAAKYVGRINIMLGGYPTITATNSYLDMKVGSKKSISLTIDAADILLEKKIKENITWTSSDESVATVDRNGIVTVTGEGETVITAKYKDQSVEVIINGEKGTAAGSGMGEGSGSGGISEVSLGDGDGIKVKASGGSGQAWRVYEMDEKAEELPEIKKNNDLIPVIVIIIILLVLGIAGRTMKFYREVRG